MEKERFKWIDTAKGIGMILTIIGHSYGGVIRGTIFSFHMPLFFILSMYTTKLSKNNDEAISKIIKSFKHLIIPAFWLYFIKFFIYKTIVNLETIMLLSTEEIRNYIGDLINVFVYGSGAATRIGSAGNVMSIGIPWFLLVLFISKSLYDFFQMNLSNRNLNIVVVLCSILGFCLGQVQWMPLSFDLALFVIPFLHFGVYMRKVEFSNTKSMVVSFFVWAITLVIDYITVGTYMELAYRRYTLYPLCYVTAISGAVFVCCISKKITENNIFNQLSFIGKNSLYLLCIHELDYLWGNLYLNIIFKGSNIVFRLITDLLIFYLILFIKSKNRNFIKLLRKKNNDCNALKTDNNN